jgi:hypothetical protein
MARLERILGLFLPYAFALSKDSYNSGAPLNPDVGF